MPDDRSNARVAFAPATPREQDALPPATPAEALVCPVCRASTLPGADICEACGSWLLQGRCMFCAAAVAGDDVYCGECGNPTAGIPCPRCASRSLFDFCKTCAVPLSAVAQGMARAAAEDPTQQQLAALLLDLQRTRAAAPPAPRTTDDSVRRMKAMRAAISASQAPALAKVPLRALFSEGQKKQINLLGDDILREGERMRLEEERRRQQEEWQRQEAERQRLAEAERREAQTQEINRRLSALQARTFESQQDARRYFMSILAGLPEELTRSMVTGGLVWRCNAYNCEHASPGDCGDPSRGGVWLLH
jgi:hypothetical protein